ncbi:MAG: hypothetical protein ABII74_07875, partial [Elusimicrobiota bacterium]
PKGFWNIGGDEIPAKIVKNNLSPEGAKVFSVFSILFSCALSGLIVHSKTKIKNYSDTASILVELACAEDWIPAIPEGTNNVLRYL